jgi:hypothetical protein
MGNMWNAKPCKCLICNASFLTIFSGRTHLWNEHNIIWTKTREHLEAI